MTDMIAVSPVPVLVLPHPAMVFLNPDKETENSSPRHYSRTLYEKKYRLPKLSIGEIFSFSFSFFFYESESSTKPVCLALVCNCMYPYVSRMLLALLVWCFSHDLPWPIVGCLVPGLVERFRRLQCWKIYILSTMIRNLSVPTCRNYSPETEILYYEGFFDLKLAKDYDKVRGDKKLKATQECWNNNK